MQGRFRRSQGNLWEKREDGISVNVTESAKFEIKPFLGRVSPETARKFVRASERAAISGRKESFTSKILRSLG